MNEFYMFLQYCGFYETMFLEAKNYDSSKSIIEEK
jgi:hypothetical protein